MERWLREGDAKQMKNLVLVSPPLKPKPQPLVTERMGPMGHCCNVKSSISQASSLERNNRKSEEREVT